MTAAATTRDVPAPAEAGRLTQIWQGITRSRTGSIGLAIVIIHIVVALSAPFIISYTATEFDSAHVLTPPSRLHLLGTDGYGRDVLTRVLLGGRLILVVSQVGTLLAVAWGGTLGILVGYLGGRIDEVVMRLVDALLSIPGFLMLMLIVMAVGSSPPVLILILSYSFGLGVIRIARGATLAFVARDFISSARARGERAATIVFSELIPNVLDVLLVEFALRSSWMLLELAGLSFLGLGISPPTPDWGLMISENRTRLAVAPWATMYPAIALTSLGIGINLLADAVSKALGLDRAQGVPS